MKEALKQFLRATGLLGIAERLLFHYQANVIKRRLRARRREIMRSYDPRLFYLNIGSRLFVRENWRLLDYTRNPSYKVGDSGELLDYNIDLTTCPKFPIPDASVDLLFSSHCLEHLGDAPSQNIFNEAHRLLKPEGVFRVVLPDADLFYDAYRRNDIAWFQGTTKLWKPEWPIEMHYFRRVAARFMGTIDGVREDAERLPKEAFFEKYHKETYDPNDKISGHITWFNFDKIKRMAQNAGFTNIHRSGPHQSLRKEMAGPQFDIYKKFSLYVDIVR